jgi:hypothetical protein
MDNSATSIENLIERIEQYGKTTFELYKCHTAYESAALFSYLAVKIILGFIFIIVMILFTIALALWIGDTLGKTAYGFLIMGSFFTLVGLIFYGFQKPLIKTKMSNVVIKSFKLKHNHRNS